MSLGLKGLNLRHGTLNAGKHKVELPSLRSVALEYKIWQQFRS